MNQNLSLPTQNTNLVVHPHDPAPITSTDSGSNNSYEMYEETLAEHFSSLQHRTYPLPLKTITPNPTLSAIETNTPQRSLNSTIAQTPNLSTSTSDHTTPRHVNPPY